MTPLTLLNLAVLVASSTPDEDEVTPGVIGFFAIFFLAAATILLMLDMVRRVRRTRYRGEVREQLEREQAEHERAAAGHPAAGHPAAGHPAAGHPAAAHPAAGHPVADPAPVDAADPAPADPAAADPAPADPDRDRP